MQINLQFCQDDSDITGSPTESRDATEVRAWEGGELLGAVETYPGGKWHASASDRVPSWTDLAAEAYDGWPAALSALLAIASVYLPDRSEFHAGGTHDVWNTEELQRDFWVVEFLAPYVAVTRKSDNVNGTLRFDPTPGRRAYFDFKADA